MITKSKYNEIENFDVELNNSNTNDFILNSNNLSSKIDIHGKLFENFSFDIIVQYKDFLLQSSRYIEFKEEWNYKPAYMSLHIFNNPTLFPLVFYINNVQCARDFSSDKLGGKIRVPSSESMAVLVDVLSKQQKANVITKLIGGTHIMFDQFLIKE